VIPSNKEFAAVVQLDVFRLFKQYFMSICRGAEVISELDYKGYATTIFAKPLGTASSNPYINAIFELLQDDYKGENQFSFRKNDALGICPSNGRLQLIEVTTADNVLSANRQILEKTALLKSLAKQLSQSLATKPLRVPMPYMDAGPSPWTPPPGYVTQISKSQDQITFGCYEPTNDPARVPSRLQGVILYEIHRQKLERVPETAPVVELEKFRQAIKTLPPNVTPEEAKRRGARHVDENPGLARWLQSLGEGLVVLVGILLAAVILLAGWELAAVLAFITAFVTAATAAEAKNN
jgi:hypothetical protein